MNKVVVVVVVVVVDFVIDVKIPLVSFAKSI